MSIEGPPEVFVYFPILPILPAEAGLWPAGGRLRVRIEEVGEKA